FSRSVVSGSLQPHELHHARPPCPSPNPGVHPNPSPSKSSASYAQTQLEDPGGADFQHSTEASPQTLQHLSVGDSQEHSEPFPSSSTVRAYQTSKSRVTMSPGFSSQWNSSQPAWNTYSFPRASLHYQSHASYTYCTGHPA
ncbi:unnamed protein product, partial [Rangifer tarandus platyrhynchus]